MRTYTHSVPLAHHKESPAYHQLLFFYGTRLLAVLGWTFTPPVHSTVQTACLVVSCLIMMVMRLTDCVVW